MGATGTVEAEMAGVPARRGLGLRAWRQASSRRLDLLAVALPALLALGLCLYDLTTRSLWLDEAAAAAIASQHGGAFGAALAHDGGNMLGYYGLLHVLIGWFGSGAFVIRFPSAVATVVTVACAGALALRLFGRRTAVWTGILAATSLTLVYWGQDARGYAAMVALITASFIPFVALLERGASWRPWVAYVVLMTAAVYAGLEAALVIPAQLVLLVWRRDRWRSVLSAAGAVALLCVPLGVLAASRGSGQLFWVPAPSFRVVRQVVQALTSAGLQPDFYTSTTTALLILSLVLVLAGGAAAVRQTVRTGRDAAVGPILIVSWLVVPVVLAAIESAVGQSIFQARYLLVSLPAVSLLIAWAASNTRMPRALVLVTMMALIALRILQLVPAYGVSSENWRGATAYVVSHRHRGDCIAFYPLDNRQAFRYYLISPEAAPRPILPAVPWRWVRPFVEDYSSLSPEAVTRLPGICGRVWLVASHEGRVGGPAVSRANYRRFAALTSGLQRLYPASRSGNFGAQGVVTVTLYSR
jgi:mannosyltransferase